jgi:hypothetical protein
MGNFKSGQREISTKKVMVLLAPVRRTPTGWRKIGEK